MFLAKWGFDGFKLDGQHLNLSGPDYNPASELEYPGEAQERHPEFFQHLYERAQAIKPGSVVQICPCGCAVNYFYLPYMNQAVASDPTSSAQIRQKRKVYAALAPSLAYYADHVELSDGGLDFASQIGVGGIPNAVINALRGHQHLGLHTEAITDGVLPLIESGVIDNSLKKVLPGKSVGSLILGSRHLYDYVDGNRDFVIRDVAWTNDPQIIRQNPRVMAINSAVEVDLTGQICADSIGETIISGVGGQHDFMYGGALSEGGKCFIALPSMTSKGQSKIVARLAPGAGVVTTRFQAQYIATEHGIVYLRNLPLADRAKALISIADPSVREELERAAVERFGIGFLRLK